MPRAGRPSLSRPNPGFRAAARAGVAAAARAALDDLADAAAAPLRRAAPATLAFARDLLHPERHLTATRFNAVVTPHRVFDTRRFLVEEFEAIRALVDGASIDDAVLAARAPAICGATSPRMRSCPRPSSAPTRPGPSASARTSRIRCNAWRASTRRPRSAAAGAPACAAAAVLHHHHVTAPSKTAWLRRRAHDGALLHPSCRSATAWGCLRGHLLRRPHRRLAHLVPRADARSAVLHPVRARQLPGVPGARARRRPAR